MFPFTGGQFFQLSTEYIMKKYIKYGLMALIAALGTSVVLSALIHALDAVIALGAIGTATYLLWEYLDDESAVQPA